MRFSRLLAVIVTAALAAGCAAHPGGSFLPGPGEAPAFSPQAHVKPMGGDSGLSAEVVLPASAAGTAGQIAIQGQLFPSYVSANVGGNSEVLTAGKKITSATMSFTGVPKANNEWAVFSFYRYNADGSTVFLGTEGAVVNVTKSTAHVKVTPASTNVFQAMMSLINAGLLTAADLQKNPNLATTIQHELSANHIVPQKSTGLISSNDLFQFAQAETSTWQRTVTIKGGSSARIISVTNDIGNAAEAFLAGNVHNFLGTGASARLRVAGVPCGNAVPLHLPGTNPTPAPLSCATIYGTGTGTLKIPVYGNTIVVGASNGQIPFKGILAKVGYRAPGSSATVTLPALKASELDVKVNDPFDWAFKSLPGVQVILNPAPGTTPFQTSNNFFTGWQFTQFPVEFAVPSNFSSANPKIAVNSWNPYGLTNNNFSFCTTWFVCQQLTNTKTFAIDPPFGDPGSKISYFKWKGTSGTTIAALNGCSGYTITPHNGVATITTTVQTEMVQKQSISFGFTSTKGCGSVPAAGSTITVQAKDSTGNTYFASGQSVGANPRNFSMTIDTFNKTTTMLSVTITIKTSDNSNTALDLRSITNDYST